MADIKTLTFLETSNAMLVENRNTLTRYIIEERFLQRLCLKGNQEQKITLGNMQAKIKACKTAIRFLEDEVAEYTKSEPTITIEEDEPKEEPKADDSEGEEKVEAAL